MIGLELVPKSADRGGIGNAYGLDGGGRLEGRICLEELGDAPKLDPVIKAAASGSAAACSVGRHDLDPFITIRLIGILMNFALLCQGEKSSQDNEKYSRIDTCCEKDSLTCMSTGTKRGLLKTGISPDAGSRAS